MANKILWVAESGATIMTTELNSLADGSEAIDGADYDNATNKFTEASFLLYIAGLGGVPDGGGIELHAIYKVDGTNYGDSEDGDLLSAADMTNAGTLVGIFKVRAANDAQYVQCMGVPLKPFAVRFAIRNECGQALNATGNTLAIYPHDYEVQ